MRSTGTAAQYRMTFYCTDGVVYSDQIEIIGSDPTDYTFTFSPPIDLSTCDDSAYFEFDFISGDYARFYGASTDEYSGGACVSAGCGDVADLYFILEGVKSQHSSWPMFQHDAQHTGYSNYTVISPLLSQAWTYPTQGLIQASPTVYNGAIYIGSSDGNIYAIDAIQGTLKWKFTHDPATYSSAAAGMNKVFIAFTGCNSEDASLYSLDSETGDLLWTFRIGPKNPGQGGGQSPPVVVDGIVYVGSSGPTAEDNKLHAINAETGDLIWSAQIIDPNETRKGVFSSPAVTENNVIVGTWGSCYTCPTLFAFDRGTGTQKWSAIVDTPYIFPAPSTANGVVYVRSGGAGWSGELIAFDEETGDELWSAYVGNSFSHGSPAIENSTVYIASGWNIYAFDALTGIEKWSVPAVSAGSCPNAATIAFPYFAVANGMIFIKSNNSCDVAKVYAVGTTDGSLLWDSGLLGDNGAPGGSDSSTPSVANGWLYFAVGDTLYAYSSEPLLSLSFPLKINKDPYTARISTVFDHSMKRPYCPNDVVTAYTGEKGKSKYGKSEFHVDITGCGDLYGFKNKKGDEFTINGNYTGGPFLYYDGHPGYDYPAKKGKRIVAPAGGTLCVSTKRTAPDGKKVWRDTNYCPYGPGSGCNAGSWAKGHVFYIVHNGSSYATWYIHSDRLQKKIREAIIKKGFVEVNTGQVVAFVGKKGAKGPHLHFEVRKNCVPVDPYGWEGKGDDPYKKAENIRLWK